MAGDPVDEFFDPETVRQQQQHEGEAAEPQPGLLRRLASGASQSFKKGLEVVANLVVKPNEESTEASTEEKYEESPAEGSNVPGVYPTRRGMMMTEHPTSLNDPARA